MIISTGCFHFFFYLNISHHLHSIDIYYFVEQENNTWKQTNNKQKSAGMLNEQSQKQTKRQMKRASKVNRIKKW